MSFINEDQIFKVQRCIQDLNTRAMAAETQLALDAITMEQLRIRVRQQEALLLLIGAENSRHEGFLEGYLNPLVNYQRWLFIEERAATAEALKRTEHNIVQKEMSAKRELTTLRRENEVLKEAMGSTVQGRRLLAEALRRLGVDATDIAARTHLSKFGGEDEADDEPDPEPKANPPPRSPSATVTRTQSPVAASKAVAAFRRRSPNVSSSRGAFSKSMDPSSEAAKRKAEKDGTDLSLDDLLSPIKFKSTNSEKSFVLTAENSLLLVPPADLSASSKKHAALLQQYLSQRDERIAQLEAENTKLIKQLTSRILR